MTWRPEGWVGVNLSEEQKELNPNPVNVAAEVYFEAGADAMLEALKKEGIKILSGDKLDEIKYIIPISLIPLDGDEFTEDGFLNFIPEGD